MNGSILVISDLAIVCETVVLIDIIQILLLNIRNDDSIKCLYFAAVRGLGKLPYNHRTLKLYFF